MDRPEIDEHFSPVQARYCRVKISGLIAFCVLLFLFLLIKYVSPIFVIFLPVVLILGLVFLISLPLNFLRTVILSIDENGIYDMRTMTKPLLWQDIRSVTEVVTYYRFKHEACAWRTFFVETDNKRFSRHSLEQTLREALGIESDKGYTVSAFLLELSHNGLRDAFSRSHRFGYFPTWQTKQIVRSGAGWTT